MDESKVAAALKAYFETEFPNPAEGELAETTNLLEDWFIDSLSIVTTVLYLEKEFGLEVRRGDINAENFRDIRTLAAFVVRSLQAR